MDGIDKTGYPFEILVSKILDQALPRYITNHPVSVLPDEANLPQLETAIDFKAWTDRYAFLIECKRAAFNKWIFFMPERDKQVRLLTLYEPGQEPGSASTIRSTILSGGYEVCQGVARFFDLVDEVMTRVVKADKSDNLKGELENSSEEITKAAKQSSIAALSAWHNDYSVLLDNLQKKIGKARFYVPVIVTAAEIFVASLDISKIDARGIVTADILEKQSKEWVFLRYALPRSLWLPRGMTTLNIFEDNERRDMLRKLDVAIVNVNSLKKFFAHLSVF